MQGALGFCSWLLTRWAWVVLLQDAQVWAVDVSPVAAAYARYNADACSVGGLVHIAQGSWYEPVGHLAGRVGGIVSNPPYIPREQMAGLQAEVGRHEPTLALDGGEGPGLDSLEVRG
jgi:release factor glutamine methyltransferase